MFEEVMNNKILAEAALRGEHLKLVEGDGIGKYSITAPDGDMI